MCRYAEMFVPGKEETNVIIPEGEAELVVHRRKEAHPDFYQKYCNQKGVFFSIDTGHCLCQFTDWSAFFLLMERIRQVNNAKFVPVLVYWSEDRYELTEPLVIDIEIDDINKEPEEGLLIHVQYAVSKRLTRSLGKRIKLEYKSGKVLQGILEIYDLEGMYGALRVDIKTDLTYFNDREIASVTWPK